LFVGDISDQRKRRGDLDTLTVYTLSAQEWTNRTLISHERTSVHCQVVFCHLLRLLITHILV